MLNTNTSERTHKVLATIEAHKSTGITTVELAEKLGCDRHKVRNSIETLRGNRLVKQGARTHSTAYWIPHSAPMLQSKSAAKPKEYKRGPHTNKAKLTQPQNGPGHTMKPMPKLDAPTSAPHKTGTVRESYTGTELKAYEGRPGANDAFACPSIVNGVEVQRKRPSPICVGVVTGPVGAGQARRFA